MAGDRRSQEEYLSIVLEVLQTQFQFLIFGRCPVSQREIGHDVWVGTPENTLRPRHHSQHHSDAGVVRSDSLITSLITYFLITHYSTRYEVRRRIR